MLQYLDHILSDGRTIDDRLIESNLKERGLDLIWGLLKELRKITKNIRLDGVPAEI
jgi:hypothetical protein